MPEDLSWSHFFLIREKVFQSFCTKIFIIILRDIIGLENFLLSFSQSESSNFFMYIRSKCHRIEFFHESLHDRNKISIAAHLRFLQVATHDHRQPTSTQGREEIYSRTASSQEQGRNTVACHSIYASSNQRPISDWPYGHILAIEVFIHWFILLRFVSAPCT